jgi:hypothetical protein
MSFKNSFGFRPSPNHVTAYTVSDPAVIGIVGSRLREMYDNLLNEPVPERLLEVLQRFDRANVPPPTRGDPRNGMES